MTQSARSQPAPHGGGRPSMLEPIMAKRNREKFAVNEYRCLFHGEKTEETHHVKAILGGGWYVPAYGCCGIDRKG